MADSADQLPPWPPPPYPRPPASGAPRAARTTGEVPEAETTVAAADRDDTGVGNGAGRAVNGEAGNSGAANGAADGSDAEA
ncbi:MAG: hypothetical protein OEV40_27185, partial [Acidimicrobiia bacterium]|nr:hypothetical protein [Acidimicrobiia bacterium]